MPRGFQAVEAPRFHDNRHMKVVRLSALRTGRLYPIRKYSWYLFLLEDGRIMSMKTSNNTNGNRSLNLSVCTAVPQPATSLCAPNNLYRNSTNINLLEPTGHVMHQQFNIQQLYVLPTLYLCVLCLSENKQRLVPLTS